MMVRSRSSVPPITGTAIAAIMKQTSVATMMSMKAAPRASVTGRLVGLRRNGDERLQLEEALLADALDVHQVLDPLEAAALGPVFENAFGGLAADARQRLELLERRGVEIDRGLRRRRRGLRGRW